jgi:hypothetical protein
MMKKPTIPTGWEQLATVAALANAANQVAIAVPNQDKWRKYVIGIAGGAGAAGAYLARIPGSNVPSALLAAGDHPTFFGPFPIGTVLYPTIVTGGAASQTINITLFVSIEGEVDELIRYLHQLNAHALDWDGMVGYWNATDFVEGGGVDFGTSSTRNYHPILQLGVNGDAAVGGTVAGVMPPKIPYYWKSCTIRVIWCGDTNATTEQVHLEVAVEADADTFDIDADSFDTAVPLNVLVPANQGVLEYTDFVLSKAEADLLNPGERFRLLVLRDASAPDDYPGIVDIVAVAMWINK